MANSGTSTSCRKRKRVSIFDWETLKPDVFRIYILENQTLNVTMSEVEQSYGHAPSETTWKLKLKEWDFNKKISTHDWQWMHLKRRERVQAGIETRFFHRLVEVTPEMFEDFEKRKTEPVTLNIDKPPYIAYYPATPGESGSLSEALEPYLSTYLDSARHGHSICSLDMEAEEVMAPCTTPTEAPDFADVDKWLSEQGRALPHCGSSPQLNDYEDERTSHRKAIFEELSDLEKILSQSHPQDDYFEENLFQEENFSPDLCGIGSHVQEENSISEDHLFLLEMTLAEYQYKYGEMGVPTLKQHFETARVLDRIGNYEEAEYHYRKVIAQHWQTDAETFLGIILAKVKRLEGSMAMLIRALTSFIILFDTHSLGWNICLFEDIEYLFTALLLLIEQDATSWSVCLCQLMATLHRTACGETMAQIYPQLFICGFSIAWECSLLGFIDSSDWMYEVLLRHCTESLDIVDHAMEKAIAHRRYAVLLRNQKKWRSSTHQLLMACRSASHSVTLNRAFCKEMESDYLELFPHLEKSSAQELRESLDRLRPEVVLSIRDILGPVERSCVDEFPMWSTNFHRSPLSQLDQFAMPAKNIGQIHPKREPTARSSTTSTSWSGSHDAWSDGTWGEYSGVPGICARLHAVP